MFRFVLHNYQADNLLVVLEINSCILSLTFFAHLMHIKFDLSHIKLSSYKKLGFVKDNHFKYLDTISHH